MAERLSYPVISLFRKGLNISKRKGKFRKASESFSPFRGIVDLGSGIVNQAIVRFICLIQNISVNLAHCFHKECHLIVAGYKESVQMLACLIQLHQSPDSDFRYSTALYSPIK